MVAVNTNMEIIMTMIRHIIITTRIMDITHNKLEECLKRTIHMDNNNNTISNNINRIKNRYCQWRICTEVLSRIKEL